MSAQSAECGNETATEDYDDDGETHQTTLMVTIYPGPSETLSDPHAHTHRDTHTMPTFDFQHQTTSSGASAALTLEPVHAKHPRSDNDHSDLHPPVINKDLVFGR